MSLFSCRIRAGATALPHRPLSHHSFLKPFCLGLSLIGAFVVPDVAALAQNYKITNILHFPTGNTSSAFGINGLGDVVGQSDLSTGKRSVPRGSGALPRIGGNPLSCLSVHRRLLERPQDPARLSEYDSMGDQ